MHNEQFSEGVKVRISKKHKQDNGREGVVVRPSGSIVLVNLANPEEARYFKRRSLVRL